MEENLNISHLIEKNSITRLSKDYENKLLNKIKINFTDNQQKLFVASFYCFLKYDSKKDFVIDFDHVWKWLGYSRKSDAKRVLDKHFTIDIDYQVRKAAPPISAAAFKESKSPSKNLGGAGINKEHIMLTINTFKKFCLKAGTKKADEIHDYYIKLEKLLQETVDEENNELRMQLISKEQELTTKTKEIKQLHTLVKKKARKRYSYSHCVYIISNPDIKNYYKIGMTSDRNQRLDALAPGAPRSYEIEYSRELQNVKEEIAIESLLLGIFDKYRVESDTKGGKQREWLKDIDLSVLKKEMDNLVDYYHDRINYFNNKFDNTQNKINEIESDNNEYEIEEDEKSESEEDKEYDSDTLTDFESETDKFSEDIVEKDEIVKICYVCKEEKSLDEYYDRIENKDGKEGTCKTCYNNNKKILKQEKNAREIILREKGTKKCRTCLQIKDVNLFNKHGTSKDGYGYECVDCKTKNATNIENKKCVKCRVTKNIEDFNKFRLGYNKYCKVCQKTEEVINENMKKCSLCKEELSLDNFTKSQTSSDGLHNYCIVCSKQKSKERREKNKCQPKLKVTEKNCGKCKETKTVDNYYKSNSEKDGFETMCKNCVKENNKRIRISLVS
jgi:hypothetical protein